MSDALLVLDFDQTITGWNHILTKKRADTIANLLSKLTEEYNLSIYILTFANKAHVYKTVFLSNSDKLINIISTMSNRILSIEHRKYLYTINRKLSETVRDRNNMILRITHNISNKNILDYIGAYKKTNQLMILSKKEHIPPCNIFFLDDNEQNIKFASHYGFNAFLINNYQKHLSLHARLNMISNILKKQKG